MGLDRGFYEVMIFENTSDDKEIMDYITKQSTNFVIYQYQEMVA